ncbi:hypothetical protein CKO40_23545 [Halochromatium glycolicum]|uniref:Uncharacterized protein n=1 Tax=Halochromatium glycolicum TaxID=85075 RepID=A0AAJ0XC57_9GAMM|nr:hypothetical protein [Halochromatium glycolicum]
MGFAPEQAEAVVRAIGTAQDGLVTKADREANSRLHAEGFRESFSRISAFNPSSHGSHARLGAKTIGWATFVVIGSLQIMWASRAPFLHLSINKRRYPILRLRAR